MKNSELFKFCARCLSIDEHPDFKDTIQSKLSDENTLNRFINICSNHYVLPAIYLNFKRHHLLDILPLEYANQVTYIYKQNRIRNIKILEQIDELNALLAIENIRPVYLKGCAHLMSKVYSDSGERMIGDIDFLVEDKDYLKTAQLLMKDGYKEQVLNFVDVTELKHFPRLFKDGTIAAVEIHRVPVNIQFSEEFSSESVFENCNSISGKINCFAPSLGNQVIHNFIHDQLSNKGRIDKACSLRNMYDLYLLSFKQDLHLLPDLSGFRQEAEDYFLLVKNTFSTTNVTFPEDTKKGIRYTNSCYYFMDHPLLIKIQKRISLIFRLIFIRYGFKIFSALGSKKSREYISRRLLDKKWYGYHFNGIRKGYK